MKECVGVLADRISQAIMEAIDDVREEAQQVGEDLTRVDALLAILFAVTGFVGACDTPEARSYWTRKLQ
jgi:hypothetical protein